MMPIIESQTDLALREHRRLMARVWNPEEHRKVRDELWNIMAGTMPVPKHLQFEAVSGEVLGIPLLETNKVTVLNCILHEGTELEWHTHDEKEWLIVYSGAITVHTEGIGGVLRDQMLSGGDFIVLDRRAPHRVTAAAGEPSLCIVVTWPGSSDLTGITIP